MVAASLTVGDIRHRLLEGVEQAGADVAEHYSECCHRQSGERRMRVLSAAYAWDRSALDCHRGPPGGNTMSRSRREFLMTSGAALLSPAAGAQPAEPPPGTPPAFGTAPAVGPR